LITLEQLPMVEIISMNDTHLEETLIINKLENAANSNELDAVLQSLNELLSFTTSHYKEEETLMQDALYPELKAHKDEHDKHIHEIKSVIKYFKERQDAQAITAYVNGTLVAWTLNHIKTMDIPMAKYVKANV